MNHTSSNSPSDTGWSGRKSEKQNNGVSDDFLYDNILCDNPDEIKSEEVSYVQDEKSQDCLYDDILSSNLSVVQKPSVPSAVPYKYNKPNIVPSIASNLSVLPTSSTTCSSLPVVTSVETNYSDSKLLTSVETLTVRNKMLERNFLSLVQTCRKEIKSKNQQIKDLTRELEEILFRRAGPLLTTNDFEKILRRTRPPCDFSCLGAPPRINEVTPKLGSKTSKVNANENSANESKKKSNESVLGSRNSEKESGTGIKSRLGWRKDNSYKDINGKKNDVRDESSSKLDVIQMTADSNRYLRKKTGSCLVLSELSENLSCNTKDVRKLESEPKDKLSNSDSVKQLPNPVSRLDNDLTPKPTSNTIEESGLKLSVKSTKHHNISAKSQVLNQVIETKSLIPSTISNSTQPTGNKFSSDHVVKISAQIARPRPEQNQQMSRIEENGDSKTFPSDDQLEGKESREVLDIVKESSNFPRLEDAKAACLSKHKPCQNTSKKYNKDLIKKHNNLGSSVSTGAENRKKGLLTVIDIFQAENLQSPQNMIKSRLENSATVVQEVQASSTAKSGVKIPKKQLNSSPESNKTKKKAVQIFSSVIGNPEKNVTESFMDKDSPPGNSKPEIGSPTNKSSQSFKNATWKCLLCCLGFRTRKELRDHRREYNCFKKERSGTKISSEIENVDRSVSDIESLSPLQLKCSGEETSLISKLKDEQENSRRLTPKSKLIDLHQKNLTELEDGLIIKSSNSGVKHVAHTEETLPFPDLPKIAEQEINDEELSRAIRSITPAEDTEDDLLLVHLDEDEAIFGSDEEAKVKIGISEKDVLAKNVSTSRVIDPVQKKLLCLATSSQKPTVSVSKDFRIPRKKENPERNSRTPDQENRTPKDYSKPNAGHKDSSYEKKKKRRKSSSPKIRDKTRSRGRSRSPRNRSTRMRGLQSRGRSQKRKNEETSSTGKCTQRKKKRSRRDISQRPSNKRLKLGRRSQSLSPSRLEDSASLATLEETRNNLLRILQDDIEDGEIMDSDQECPLIVRENDKVAKENKKTNSMTSEPSGPSLMKKKKFKEMSSNVIEKYRGDKERLDPKPSINPIIQPDKEIKKSGSTTKHGNRANDSGSDKENSKIKKTQTVHSSHVEDSLRITRESLLVYTDEDINHRILPFKQKQLMELSAEERSLKDIIRSRSRSKSRTPSRKNSNSLDESKPTVSPLKLCLRSLKDGDIREPSSSSESLQEYAKELDLAQLETSVMGSLLGESDNAVFDNISSYREKSKKIISKSEIISGENADLAMNREAPMKQVMNDLVLSESETDSPIKSNTKSLLSGTSLTSPSLEINHPVTPRCPPASLNSIDSTSAEGISNILRSPLYSFQNKTSDLPSLKNVEQPMERKIDKLDLKRAKKTRKRLSIGDSLSVISVVSTPSSSSNKIVRESKTYESTIIENRVQIANGIFKSNVKNTCGPKATILENTSSKYLQEVDSASKNILATPPEEMNASELKNEANAIILSPVLGSKSKNNQESASTQELNQKCSISDRQKKKKKRSKLSFGLTTPEVLFVHSE